MCNHQKAWKSDGWKALLKIKEQIKKWKLKKDKHKTKLLKLKYNLKKKCNCVSLTTSKENYIDPRILISFLKKLDIPIDKFFTKTFQKKFWWCFDVDKKYQF